MRRRSGALHCQSEQDFIQLASAAHNHMGIFYDQKINKRVMNDFKITKEPTNINQYIEISNPQQFNEKSKESYSGFQFGLETQAQRQERQELERLNTDIKEQQMIAILSEDALAILSQLRKQQNLEATIKNSYLGLAIRNVGRKIIKYWVICKNQLDNKNQLLNLYLQKSQIIIDQRQNWEIIKNEIIQSNSSVIKTWKSMLE